MGSLNAKKVKPFGIMFFAHPISWQSVFTLKDVLCSDIMSWRRCKLAKRRSKSDFLILTLLKLLKKKNLHFYLAVRSVNEIKRILKDAGLVVKH